MKAAGRGDEGEGMDSVSGGLSAEQRKQQLARVLQALRGWGGRVEPQNEYQALIAFGGNGMSGRAHLVHAFLTLAFIGLWVPVWAIHYARSRGWRRLVSVDEAGSVTGDVWKPPRDATSAPEIGKRVSREGRANIAPGKNSVSIDPGGWTLSPLSRVVCLLANDPGPGISLRLVRVEPKINIFTVYLSANAQHPTEIYWFVLN